MIKQKVFIFRVTLYPGMSLYGIFFLRYVVTDTLRRETFCSADVLSWDISSQRHFAVRRYVVRTFCLETCRRRDTSPWDVVSWGRFTFYYKDFMLWGFVTVPFLWYPYLRRETLCCKIVFFLMTTSFRTFKNFLFQYTVNKYMIFHFSIR